MPLAGDIGARAGANNFGIAKVGSVANAALGLAANAWILANSVNVPNLQIAFGGGSSQVIGTPNATFNVTSNTMSVEGNIKLANGSSLYFGGQQSNTVANSLFQMTYNASANSIDINFI